MSGSEHRSDETSPGDAVRPPRGVDALGQFIRSQRRIAELSQRELARLADLSDAYLSQLERGLHEPSVRVVNGISSALNIPSDKLFEFLRPGSGESDAGDEVGDPVATAILTDERLTDAQKQSLLDVLRAFLTANGYDVDGTEPDDGSDEEPDESDER